MLGDKHFRHCDETPRISWPTQLKICAEEYYELYTIPTWEIRYPWMHRPSKADEVELIEWCGYPTAPWERGRPPLYHITWWGPLQTSEVNRPLEVLRGLFWILPFVPIKERRHPNGNAFNCFPPCPPPLFVPQKKQNKRGREDLKP